MKTLIHTVFIDTSSEYQAIKKEFRKCLMTGGAVIRIKEGLTKNELLEIRNKFYSLLEPHNVASMIINEVDKKLVER